MSLSKASLKIWKPLDPGSRQCDCTLATSGVSLAEPVSVLLCRNSRKRRTRGIKRGWSLSGSGRKGKKSESGRESGGTARGRRSESGNGRGKERGNGKETKIETAEPETETAIGTGTETTTRLLFAVDPGKNKNIPTFLFSISIKICFQSMRNVAIWFLKNKILTNLPNIMHFSWRKTYFETYREVSRDREKKHNQENEEEAYERRKLERKLRDKEAAYQEVGILGKHCPSSIRAQPLSMFQKFHNVNIEYHRSGYHWSLWWVYLIKAYLVQFWPQRLKNWELRERKKARDYAKDTERENERRRDMVRGHKLNSVVHRRVPLDSGCCLTVFIHIFEIFNYA